MAWNNSDLNEKGAPYEEGQVLGYTPTNDATTNDAVFGDVSHGPNYRAVRGHLSRRLMQWLTLDIRSATGEVWFSC